MDDLVIFIREQLSEAAQAAVANYFTEGWYGEHLVLEKSSGSDVFGFMTELGHGTIGLRPRLSFIHRMQAWRRGQQRAASPIEVCGGLHGGSQFRPASVETSVASGMLSRMLDMTNVPEQQVQVLLTRVVIELACIGFDKALIEKALRKVAMTSRASTTMATKALSWTGKQMRAWRTVHDAFEERRVALADEYADENAFNSSLEI